MYNVETKKSTVLDKDSKDSCYNPLISDDGSKIVMNIGGDIYLYNNSSTSISSSTSKVKKTRQTKSYADFDDG